MEVVLCSRRRHCTVGEEEGGKRKARGKNEGGELGARGGGRGEVVDGYGKLDLIAGERRGSKAVRRRWAGGSRRRSGAQRGRRRSGALDRGLEEVGEGWEISIGGLERRSRDRRGKRQSRAWRGKRRSGARGQGLSIKGSGRREVTRGLGRQKVAGGSGKWSGDWGGGRPGALDRGLREAGGGQRL
uniref:Uncharacterized protein LOC105035900 n=1 Tax=Elaeis guineensis var. tenera TaxID=51953 RepID=A0A6I9QI47_ELAGV|nr:uncharacterized protein LOC105035900 [Elaeis guineensis]